jgi:pimeloyl-ACP methyl ester carboxylesterase
MLLLAALAAIVAGCGGSGRDLKPLVQQGPLGSGADEVWFYAAKEKPRSTVIFLHGYGGPTEETPANHIAWLKHLAAKGNDVIYPRYEQGPYPDPYGHIDAAVQKAMAKLGKPDVPRVVIGYSRGGRIAVDYAALEALHGHEPKLVVALFPGRSFPAERLGPLDRLDAKTKIVFMVGDRDTVVGGLGARALLRRLEQAQFPPERIQVIGVKSKGSFRATHFSALEATPAARAAIWRPVDRLIAGESVGGGDPGYPVAAARWR